MTFRSVTSLALALLLVGLLSLNAEAKRLGGGGSFGGRTTYSKPYSRPVSPASTPSPSSQPAPSQVRQPGAAPVGAPGMGSRLGWGLGGLLAGGLIGSMLFGNGFGGGMGGGMGMLDIILIGLIIFMAVRLFRGRKKTEDSGSVSQGPWTKPPTADGRTRAQQSWDNLRSPGAPSGPQAGPTAAPSGGFGDGSATSAAQPVEPVDPIVPEGFSIPDFLQGAKTVYTRLQASWDRRDLADIALFTTPEVLAEITRQAAADASPSRTELIMISARLLEFKEDPKLTVATVYFDVLLREEATEAHPKQVREVWHFARETNNPDSNWKLEGIQQMDN